MPRPNLYFAFLVLILSAVSLQITSLPERVFHYVLTKVERESLEPVSRRQLLEGALDGLTQETADHPYSAYLPPEEEEEYEDEIQGKVAGIGIFRMSRDPESRELWFSPIYDSPAREAGLRFGDRIVAADGVELASLSFLEIADHLRGEPGSNVTLSVRRRETILAEEAAESKKTDGPSGETRENLASDGQDSTKEEKSSEKSESSTEEKPTEETVPAGSESKSPERGENPPEDASPLEKVTLARRLFSQDIVSGDRRDADGKWIWTLETAPEIGYIRIEQFTDDTAPLFEKAIDQLTSPPKNDAARIKGLILDLRGNPGGFLPAAIAVCDHFLDAGQPIVTTRRRDGSIKGKFTATEREKLSIPLAILIDGGSASASEIVSSALQDHQRATVIGQRSYGKGTVQELFPLPCDMGLLRLTDASFWRPSGEPIHRKKHQAAESEVWGVTPNPGLEIPLTDRQKEMSALYRDLRTLPPETEKGDDFARIVAMRLANLQSDEKEEGDEETDDGVKDEKASKKAAEKSHDEKKSSDTEMVEDGPPPYFDPILDRAVQFLTEKTN